jgi:hypothetical protein
MSIPRAFDLNTLRKNWLLSFIFSPALLRGNAERPVKQRGGEQAVIYQQPAKD